MIPLTILDNFYETPSLVRNFALRQTFSKDRTVDHPGTRTDFISELDKELFNVFVLKILNLFFDTNKDNVSYTINSFFQMIPESFEEGWTHNDGNVSMAGIVYLTPDAPLNGGTLICKEKEPGTLYDYQMRNDFYNQKDIDLNLYRKFRDAHNNKFDTTIEISNVYNRLVIYDGRDFHREHKFFGNNIQNNRLTQVFFAEINPNNCYGPAIRTRLFNS